MKEDINNCIKIMSRDICINKLNGKLNKKCIIISINDFNYKRKSLPKNKDIIDILSLEFDDIDRIIKDKDIVKHKPISDEDVNKIKNFFFKYIDLIKSKKIELWVHCTMGISRSAAVAFVLIKYLFGDDMSLFETGDYIPLKYIYIKMTKGLGLTFSEEEFNRKMNISNTILSQKVSSYIEINKKEENLMIKLK